MSSAQNTEHYWSSPFPYFHALQKFNRGASDEWNNLFRGTWKAFLRVPWSPPNVGIPLHGEEQHGWKSTALTVADLKGKTRDFNPHKCHSSLPTVTAGVRLEPSHAPSQPDPFFIQLTTCPVSLPSEMYVDDVCIYVTYMHPCNPPAIWGHILFTRSSLSDSFCFFFQFFILFPLPLSLSLSLSAFLYIFS